MLFLLGGCADNERAKGLKTGLVCLGGFGV
jgi:hypothetical protein